VFTGIWSEDSVSLLHHFMGLTGLDSKPIRNVSMPGHEDVARKSNTSHFLTGANKYALAA